MHIGAFYSRFQPPVKKMASIESHCSLKSLEIRQKMGFWLEN